MADLRTERRWKNRRRARRALILDGATGIFDRLEPRLLLATDVWTGAVNGNWSNSGNWLSGSAPSAGDDLDFPSSGVSNFTTTNDFAAGTHFDNITIAAAGYSLGGNAIDLDGDISATYGSGTSTISADLALQSSPHGRRRLGRHAGPRGLISGTGYGLSMAGGGTIEFAGSRPPRTRTTPSIPARC